MLLESFLALAGIAHNHGLAPRHWVNRRHLHVTPLGLKFDDVVASHQSLVSSKGEEVNSTRHIFSSFTGDWRLATCDCLLLRIIIGVGQLLDLQLGNLVGAFFNNGEAVAKKLEHRAIVGNHPRLVQH